MALYQLTLRQARQKLQRGEISSAELTEALIQRINAVDEQVRAYITPTFDAARRQARAADQVLSALRDDILSASKGQVLSASKDRRRAAGQDNPLLGIPLAIKDVICVQGAPTTCGSRILENFVPPYDAAVVGRLKAAGAVFLGKTNTDEFAMGSSTENSAYFTTHNPWDLTRVPGGSSGGSAAAVAAGMCLGALGSDTGGSVRQPAALCGVVGLKPSYGRVSRYGLVAFASSLDQVGILAQDVADAAILLGVIAGHDPRDSTSLEVPVPDYYSEAWGKEADLRGLRVGVPKEYFIEGMQAEVEVAVRKAVDELADLGAEVREVSLPHTDYALPVYYLIAPAEASANLARYDGVRYGYRAPAENLIQVYCESRGQGFGPEVKRRIMLGTFTLSAGYFDAYYLKAQKARTLIKGDFDAAFEQVDVIAAPVTPTTAFKIGDKVHDPLEMYLADVFTLSMNLAGLCGLSLPCGFDEQGLPIGMQLMGPALGEEVILRVARAYEAATEWHRRKPAL
ncbi:MAG: Asp-tRNA(Asn)/Glu-tRNA(Gln) amidotransferase subunit GatA [Anaerolineae bacterium]|jgi:aspartyl-tRNA(Asn)/glutamyl-tRNA(Gln) amidotransferase subunit A